MEGVYVSQVFSVLLFLQPFAAVMYGHSNFTRINMSVYMVCTIIHAQKVLVSNPHN